MKTSVVLLITILLLPALVLAQGNYNAPETGEKPLGTYFATDIDSVSLTNGNLHLRIPLFSLPGRSVPASLGLEYDSQFYNYVSFPGPPSTYGYEYMGWRKSSELQFGRLTAMRDNGAWNLAPPSVTYNLTFTWAPPSGSRYTFTTQRTQTCTTIENYVCNGASPSDATLYDNLTIDPPGPETLRLLTGTQFSGGSTPAYIIYKDGTRLNGQTSARVTTNGNYLSGGYYGSATTSNFGTSLGDVVPAQDTLGRLIGYLKSGLTETITLTDANGGSQVYQIVQKTIHAYDPSEPLFVLNQDWQVIDYVQLPNGKRYTFDYNPEGMVSKVTLPSGAYIRYGYAHPATNLRLHVASRWVSADGTAASEKLTSYSYTYSFYGPSALIPPIAASVTDPAGDETRYTYAGTNICCTGLPVVITTSTAGQVLKRIDRTWGGTYGGAPQLVSETTSMSDKVRKTQYTYDSHNNVTRQEDFDWGPNTPGLRLRYTDKTYLDSACTSDHICNRVTSEKIYTNSSTLVAQTDYEYDNYTGSNALVTRSGTIPGWSSPTGARANVTAVKQWLNTTSSWLVTTQQYDVLGNKVKVTDPGGHATNTDFTDRFSGITGTNTFAYPTRVTDPSGFYVDTTYDFNTGLVKQTTDSLNRTTTKTYDLMNRLTAENYPNGGWTQYSYVDGTLPTTAPQATKQIRVDTVNNVGTVTSIYDGLFRETQKQTADPEGTIYVDTQYDAKGRKWKVSNPRRAAAAQVWTQFTYDALDRPTVTTAPDNSSVQYAYNGNQTTVTDEAGNQRRYTYDGLGQMTKVEEPNPSLVTPLMTTYTYNVLGKMTQSNQSAQIRSWAFDSLGRMTSETLPESGTTTFSYASDSYNPDGLLRTKTDARGTVTTMEYGTWGGAMHQVQVRSYSDGTPTVSFNYNSLGLRSSMTDGLGTVTYSYDPNTDKLTQESRTLLGVTGTFSTSYAYNIKGDLTSMTYPSGRVVNFNYATGGGCCNSRLSSVVNQTSGITMINGMTFNAAGELLTRTLNPGTNGISENFSYNNRLQLSQITASVASTTVMNFTYNYGTATTNTGRVLSRTDAIQAEHSMIYGYDSIYRLGQAISQDASLDISWGFDIWGNRTAQTPRGLATSKVGTQTSGYSNNRNTTFTYDAAGNQTNDGLHNYTFNAGNQITQMDGGAAVYAYDGEGRRMKKTATVQGVTETTYYFYGPGGILCEFSTVAGTSTATTASANDRATYRTSDKLGSAVLFIASSGSVVENNRTLPYGEAWLSEVKSVNDKKFTTYQRDAESGLDYAEARYYSSSVGRFNVADQGEMILYVPTSLNRYVYALNDPVNLKDSTGRSPDFTLVVNVFAVVIPAFCPPALASCSATGGGGGGGTSEGPPITFLTSGRMAYGIDISRVRIGNFAPFGNRTDIVRNALQKAALRVQNMSNCADMFGGVEAFQGMLGKVSINPASFRDALMSQDDYEDALKNDFGYTPDHGGSNRIYLVDRPYGGLATIFGGPPGFFNVTENAQIFTILHELLHVANPTPEGQDKVNNTAFGHGDLANNCDVRDPTNGTSQWIPN